MMAEPKFDAPIPGMSLTAEVGNSPWQNPPQFSSTQQVAEYYIEKLSSDPFAEKLVQVAQTGIPLTTIANTIQMYGVMEGVHSVDSGILTLPIIMEMMILTLEAADVEYTTGLDEGTDEDPVDKSYILDRLSKMEDTETEEPVAEEMPVEQIPEPMDTGGGLMSRRM